MGLPEFFNHTVVPYLSGCFIADCNNSLHTVTSFSPVKFKDRENKSPYDQT